MSFSDSLDYLCQGIVTGLGGFSGDEETQDSTSFLSFNQDASSLTVGTEDGYKLFSMLSLAIDNLEVLHHNKNKEIVIAERLFRSSLVGVVSRDSPRTLCVTHFKKGSEICRFPYSEKIQAVKMNRARLVVCLEDSLYIHNIKDMKVLHIIRDTPANHRGLIDLSTNSDNNYLAYPGHSTIGELQIFDTMNLYSLVSIPAHEGQLAAIKFSTNGDRVATASIKGTVIRVFNCENGCKLYELRRGLKRTAIIYSLAFSPCDSFLACSSNTETLHVFKLEDKRQDPSSACGSPSEDLFGYIHNVVSAGGAILLPTQMTETLMQGRAFASVHHNLSGTRNQCALVNIKKNMRLLLASQSGCLNVYSLDPLEGGDCCLIQQLQIAGHSLDNLEKELHDCNGEREDVTSPPLPVPTYAERLKNSSNEEMTDSEKFHEMNAATETPPKQCFLLDDDGEFPPV